MPVGAGRMEVRIPLDTTVDAVRVIVMFVLVVVGTKTVVNALLDTVVDTRVVVKTPLDTIVEVIGLVDTLTAVDDFVGLRRDVSVPLDTTVVAV